MMKSCGSRVACRFIGYAKESERVRGMRSKAPTKRVWYTNRLKSTNLCCNLVFFVLDLDANALVGLRAVPFFGPG